MHCRERRSEMTSSGEKDEAAASPEGLVGLPGPGPAQPQPQPQVQVPAAPDAGAEEVQQRRPDDDGNPAIASSNVEEGHDGASSFAASAPAAAAGGRPTCGPDSPGKSADSSSVGKNDDDPNENKGHEKDSEEKEDREKLLYLLQVASDSPDEDDDSVQDDDDEDDDEDNKDDASARKMEKAKKKMKKEKAGGNQNSTDDPTAAGAKAVATVDDSEDVIMMDNKEEAKEGEVEAEPQEEVSSPPPPPRKRKATDAETENAETTSPTTTVAAGTSSSGSVGITGTTTTASSYCASMPSSDPASGVTNSASPTRASARSTSTEAARSTGTGTGTATATAPMPNGGLDGLAATALTNAMVAPISTVATGMGSATAMASINAANATIAPRHAHAPATTDAFPVPSSTTAATITTSTSPKKRRRKAAPRKPTFAQKLMTILSDPECQEVISWMPDGQSFVIANLNPGIFGPLVMGRYFGNRSAKFESFTRKLNRWGFKRITTRGSGMAVTYCHHLFQRDNPDLCNKMKGDGGLRATDEERQAAAAAGIDPRRAQGLEGMSSAQIAQRQAELEKERVMRKAGLVDPPYNKKAGRRNRGVPSVASIPVSMPSTAARSTATVPGASVGPTPIAAAPSMPGAGAIAVGPPGLVSQAANVAARELVGELGHLRRIREEKRRLQAQAALSAAAYSAATTGGSPFLRPIANGAGASVFPGGMSGVLQPSLPSPPQPSQSSMSLLEQQLRLQQQLEIEHERLYLERIKQERQMVEQRLRVVQQQQLQQQQQQQLRAASAMASPILPALPPGGGHHNPVLALAAYSGLITHPLSPPASAGTPNDGYTDALNNYYDARTSLIAAKFDAKDGKATNSGSPSNPPDSSAGNGPRKGGTGI